MERRNKTPRRLCHDRWIIWGDSWREKKEKKKVEKKKGKKHGGGQPSSWTASLVAWFDYWDGANLRADPLQQFPLFPSRRTMSSKQRLAGPIRGQSSHLSFSAKCRPKRFSRRRLPTPRRVIASPPLVSPLTGRERSFLLYFTGSFFFFFYNILLQRRNRCGRIGGKVPAVWILTCQILDEVDEGGRLIGWRRDACWMDWRISRGEREWKNSMPRPSRSNENRVTQERNSPRICYCKRMERAKRLWVEIDWFASASIRNVKVPMGEGEAHRLY